MVALSNPGLEPGQLTARKMITRMLIVARDIDAEATLLANHGFLNGNSFLRYVKGTAWMHRSPLKPKRMFQGFLKVA